ncbi:methionyl-tRNA formyltransferase [Azonexus sp.]|uniref:methionyl-tRNA formyltransferase n=1 Tax=Azonexus sp. TaxID=1872668 RepID=UPI0039E59C63
MRLIFAGTPEFSAQALSALIAAGHEIPLVLTQPDRPAGRGMSLQASAVKKVAQAHGCEVFQPDNLKSPEVQARIAAARAEVMVVAAYGLLLPQAVLDLPPAGCLNIHASLLPRWRGAAPIQRALLAGDEETGVCIMQMEAGLDTGPVLLRASLPIDAAETAASLHDKLAQCGAALIVSALEKLPLPVEIQSTDNITYAHKIDKNEAQINWQNSATQIDRQIRAFNPFPGAQSTLAGQRIKIWAAHTHPAQGPSGTLLAVERERLIVACGDAALALTEVQKAGGKRLPVREFLAGNPLQVGDRLGE